MALCTGCQWILEVDHRTDQNASLVYEHNLDSFLEAISMKCYFCKHLFESLSSQDQSTILEAHPFPGIQCTVETLDMLIRFNLGDRISPGKREVIFELYPDNPEVPISLSNSTNDESCWLTIHAWLKNCQLNHTSCHKTPSSDLWRPTRLIHVGEIDSALVLIVKAADIDPLDEEPFVALSHCWGRREFAVNNHEHEKKFEAGFPLADLAPNFHDAVVATRGLGFRYLWIDSLCILQGEDGDWQQEAPFMDRVYKNAVLTLASADSKNAYDGLFRDRDPRLASPIKLPLHGVVSAADWERERQTQQMNRNRGRIYSRFHAPTCEAVSATYYAVPLLQDWREKVANTTLNGRAWVLQERLLSKRTVYFSSEQIFWECRELAACEVFPQKLPYERGYEFVRLKQWETPMAGLKEESRNRNYGPWRQILGEYTRCSLTNPNDKLVAISGMAKECARILEDEYLAGLWRSNFVNDLLWYPDGQDVLRPSVYRAPTWSWASVDAPVKFPRNDALHANFVEKFDVDIKFVSEDITSEVKSAILQICAYLIRAPGVKKDCSSLIGIAFDVSNDRVSEEYFCLPLRVDKAKSLVVPDRHSHTPLSALRTTSSVGQPTTHPQRPWPPRRPSLGLPTYQDPNSTSPPIPTKMTNLQLTGLILRLAGDYIVGKEPVYERVGKFSLPEGYSIKDLGSIELPKELETLGGGSVEGRGWFDEAPKADGKELNAEEDERVERWFDDLSLQMIMVHVK